MISPIMYTIRRKKFNDIHSSLYSSVRFNNDTPDIVTDKSIRALAADRIRVNQHLQHLVSKTKPNYKSIEHYCSKVEHGTLPDDMIQALTLAMLCRFIIRIVSIRKTIDEQARIHITDLIEHIQHSGECIYIFHEEENQFYEPLYAINKQNICETIKIFKYDVDIRLLLDIFLQEGLPYDTELQSDDNDRLGVYDSIDEPISKCKQIEDIVMCETSTSLYNTKKKLVASKKVKIHYNQKKHDSNKRKKISTNDDTDTMQSNVTIHESEAIQEPASQQIDISNDETNEVQQENMKFEIENPEEFRCRLISEFISNNVKKDNDNPSELGSRRYFPDRVNNSHYNLLISNSYLLGDLEDYRLEFCIVTTEINHVTYVNSRFKFLVQPTNRPHLIINPMYLYLGDSLELKRYSDAFQLLPFQFIIVMLTNKELMGTKERLPIFSSSQDGIPITRIFGDKEHDALKDAYHLEEIRFAITLWSKRNDGQGYIRHVDKRYISPISNQNKHTKVLMRKSKPVIIYEQLCDRIFEQVDNNIPSI